MSYGWFIATSLNGRSMADPGFAIWGVPTLKAGCKSIILAKSCMKMKKKIGQRGRVPGVALNSLL